MRTRLLVAVGAGLAAVIVSGGLAMATTPDEPTAKLEAAAESALESWLTGQGVGFFMGTVACGVDSSSSRAVYCYAHTANGIIAVTSPIPDTPGAWEFTLLAGSLGADGNVPIPTNWPQPPSPPPTPTTAPSPTVEPAPPPSSGAPTSSFGEELQLVNVDIAPGRYQAAGSDFCYWERLSAPNDETESIIANAIEHGPAVADILATDVAFSSYGCGTWTPYVAPPEPATTFGPGAFVVGSDIVPGTYEADGGETCYWRRMASFTADDLIAIDNMTQRGTVVIEPSDVGFSSTDCGTWTLVSGQSLTG